MRQGMSNTDACRLLACLDVPAPRSATSGLPHPASEPCRSGVVGRYWCCGNGSRSPTCAGWVCRFARSAFVWVGTRQRSVASSDATGRERGLLAAPRDDDAKRQRARPKRTASSPMPRFGGGAAEAEPVLVAGRDQRVAAEDLPHRPGHAHLSRDHLRALLLRDDAGLHKRYTGKTPHRTSSPTHQVEQPHRRGSRIRNMAIITERPAKQPTSRRRPLEGDLIVGVGSASAMATLRERTTHYGIVVNLPNDHTARSVNAAIAEAFAAIPTHLKRSLTWDQGVEMAAHEQLTTASVCRVLRRPVQPWQRGANENFNGLLRQYFPRHQPCHPQPYRVGAVMDDSTAAHESASTTTRRPNDSMPRSAASPPPATLKPAPKSTIVASTIRIRPHQSRRLVATVGGDECERAGG